jgi:chromosome segregation ATPase
MDDVLSLVQAALDETGDSQEKVVLKVHQQTQTLVFKGSPEKMAVLEQALDALRPKESEQIAKMEGQVENVKQQYQNLAEQSDRQQQLLRNDLAERQALEEQVLAMKAELTQAQIELKATKQPTTRP